MKITILPIFFALSLLISSSYVNTLEFDFCVGDPSLPHGPTGYSCKDPSKVTVDDFVYSGLRVPGNTTNLFKFGASPGFVDQFPALNGMGVSTFRADLEVGGVAPLHTHRVAEIILVIEGTTISGFVDSNNKAYYKTLNKGDIMIFPPSLEHFQINVGNTPAIGYGFYASENPGIQAISLSLFRSNLPTEIIEKTTLLDSDQIKKLKNLFGGSN